MVVSLAYSLNHRASLQTANDGLCVTEQRSYKPHMVLHSQIGNNLHELSCINKCWGKGYAQD